MSDTGVPASKKRTRQPSVEKPSNGTVESDDGDDIGPAIPAAGADDSDDEIGPMPTAAGDDVVITNGRRKKRAGECGVLRQVGAEADWT